LSDHGFVQLGFLANVTDDKCFEQFARGKPCTKS
jgi:hypothetical protein